MWQPIETAPKDKQVLLYCPKRGVVRGWWKDCHHYPKPRPYWTHDRERTYGVIETRDDQPTHWMPLPDAPGAQAQPTPSVPDDIIEQAVTRFLSWKLPKDFRPDGGMVFIPTKGRGYDSPYWPSGTNLFNAEQAREMLRYVLAAAPEAKP